MPKEQESKTTTPEPKAPVMEVPVDKMQTILDRLDEQAKTISVLQASVSKTKQDEARASLDADKRPRVHFKKIQGKVVVGWGDARQERIFSPANPSVQVGEVLKCRYFFADGTQSDLLDQIELTRSSELVYARVVEDRGNSAVLEFEDKSVLSEPIEIHKQFWNA